jgi:uncharacterized protein YacL
MVCATSCVISAVFIIGMIYFYNATNKSATVQRYKSTLSPVLKEKYEEISNERMNISYKGYMLGLFLSMLIILYNVYLGSSSKKAFNWISLICIVVSTSFITNYFYYVLSPKTDSMLNHLQNKEQIKEWHTMYREMQFNYHMGLALGIIGTGVLAFAFRC